MEKILTNVSDFPNPFIYRLTSVLGRDSGQLHVAATSYPEKVLTESEAWWNLELVLDAV
jgi:hypothetical protein